MKRCLVATTLTALLAMPASAQQSQGSEGFDFDTLAACSIIYQRIGELYTERGEADEGSAFQNTAHAYSSGAFYMLQYQTSDQAAAYAYAEDQIQIVAESLNSSSKANADGDMGVITEWLPYCDTLAQASTNSCSAAKPKAGDFPIVAPDPILSSHRYETRTEPLMISSLLTRIALGLSVLLPMALNSTPAQAYNLDTCAPQVTILEPDSLPAATSPRSFIAQAALFLERVPESELRLSLKDIPIGKAVPATYLFSGSDTRWRLKSPLSLRSIQGGGGLGLPDQQHYLVPSATSDPYGTIVVSGTPDTPWNTDQPLHGCSSRRWPWHCHGAP